MDLLDSCSIFSYTILMIASLTGIITTKDARMVVLERDGIGYEVSVPGTLAKKITTGASITLHTHEYLREDTRELYGFATRGELGFFKRLISISGVGPRTALLVSGLGTIDEIKRAITSGRVEYLSAAPGVGRKTAQKIILELKGTLEEGDTRGSDEVADALVGLGYTRAEAHAASSHTSGEVVERIKAALKMLGRKK